MHTLTPPSHSNPPPPCPTLTGLRAADINVAHNPTDVTHPKWFADQDLSLGSAPQDDVGQPGYTPNERKRFTEIREPQLASSPDL